MPPQEGVYNPAFNEQFACRNSKSVQSACMNINSEESVLLSETSICDREEKLNKIMKHLKRWISLNMTFYVQPK